MSTGAVWGVLLEQFSDPDILLKGYFTALSVARL
jgi:hypothetical protein